MNSDAAHRLVSCADPGIYHSTGLKSLVGLVEVNSVSDFGLRIADLTNPAQTHERRS